MALTSLRMRLKLDPNRLVTVFLVSNEARNEFCFGVTDMLMSGVTAVLERRRPFPISHWSKRDPVRARGLVYAIPLHQAAQYIRRHRATRKGSWPVLSLPRSAAPA